MSIFNTQPLTAEQIADMQLRLAFQCPCTVIHGHPEGYDPDELTEDGQYIPPAQQRKQGRNHYALANHTD